MNLLLVRVESGIGEALSVVLAEEAAILQLHMVDFVAGALAVLLVPLFLGRFAFPSAERGQKEEKRRLGRMLSEGCRRVAGGLPGRYRCKLLN